MIRLRPTDLPEPAECIACQGGGTVLMGVDPITCPVCDGHGYVCPACGSTLSRTGTAPGTDVTAPTCSEACGWEGTP